MRNGRSVLHKDIPSCLHPYRVAPLLQSKVLWLNSSIYDQSKEQFRKDFSYFSVESSKSFGVEIDEGRAITAFAERYGGSNIAANGGGARSALIGGFLVKGVGANILAGEKTGFQHSYGGLDFIWAVTEIIYSNLLNLLLPHGSVKPVGLIYIGDNLATYGGGQQDKNYPAVLLVREPAIRPANFIRAPNFTPRKDVEGRLSSDVARVRGANKELYAAIGSHQSVVDYITFFLKRCANQNAFSAMARIAHGGMTASNMSLDGRWLDVPLTGVVDAGVNYSRGISFYEELRAPVGFSDELMQTYEKYNRTQIDRSNISSYYDYELREALYKHSEFLLCVSANSMTTQKEKESWKFISGEISRIIYSGKGVGRHKPELDQVFREDRIYCWLEAVFLTLSSSCNELLEEIFEKLDFAYGDLTFSFESFSKGIYCIYNAGARCENLDLEKFCKSKALGSLRKSFLNRLFYASTVEYFIGEHYHSYGCNDIDLLIDKLDSFSRWIFIEDRATKLITIFENESFTLRYDPCSELYFYESANLSGSKSVQSLSDAITIAQGIAEKERLISGFDPVTYLSRMNETVKFYDKNG